MRFFLIGLILVLVPYVVYGQISQPDGGGEFKIPTDEISSEMREEIQSRIKSNQDSLTQLGLLAYKTNTEVFFDWPVKSADHVFDYGVYGISNFVDRDPTFPNSLLDYNCGNRTYDLDNGYNHRGIDIFTWPNSWRKMDEDDVEVVAAAPGIIIDKIDGNYDRNCTFTGTWNAVYVQHIDGSIAWYGHLKNSSLTNKGIGESVERGEYIGVIGSSGQSTGPHLHFELQDANGVMVDPYQGSCNAIDQSYWVNQKPYYDSSVNAVRTHSAPPEFYFDECSRTEDPNFSDAFLQGDNISYAGYYRDQLFGQVSVYTILDPNLSVFNSWQASSSQDHYSASYWYWNRTIPVDAMVGTWQFQILYEGRTYINEFTVSDPSTEPLRVTLKAPFNNTEIDEAVAELRWLELADVDNYILEGSTTESFDELLFQHSNLQTNQFQLSDVEEEQIYWRVKGVNEHGEGEWSSVWSIRFGMITSNESTEEERIEDFQLFQNYPNPFNPTTTIRYQVEQSSNVTLTVFDMLGREVSILVSEYKSEGRYAAEFNAKNLPSGVYYYQLSLDGVVRTKAMTLLK